MRPDSASFSRRQTGQGVADPRGPKRGFPRSLASRQATLFAVGAAACWGFGVVVAKASLDDGMPAAGLAVVQLAASVTALHVCGVAAGSRPERRQPPARAFWSGVLEYGASGTLFAFGVARTTAGNAALIGSAEPALIVLAAVLILKEKAGRSVIASVGLATVGLVMLIGPEIARTGAPRSGDLLVLASAVTGALYAVASRRLVATMNPLRLAAWQQTAGLAALFPLAAAVLWFDGGFGAWSPFAVTLAVLSGLLQHTAAVWLHLHALRRMSAARFSLYLGLVPVFALGASSAVLGESITAPQLAGGGLVVAAAAFASRLAAHQERDEP